MASSMIFAFVLVFACFVSFVSSASLTATIRAPQYVVNISTFGASGSDLGLAFPQITWYQNPDRFKNDDPPIFNLHLISLDEGVTNDTSNYFETFGEHGHNSLQQYWTFNATNNNNESFTVIMLASQPLRNAKSLFGLRINVTVPLKDTKGSNSFQAGDIVVSVDNYAFQNSDDTTELGLGYLLTSTHDGFNQSSIDIKSNIFQIGGAYLAPSEANEVNNIVQLEAKAELPQPNPLNPAQTSGVAYFVVPHFTTNSAYISQSYFGFGSGTKSHAGAIVAVVIILILIVIIAAVIGFIIIRRRRRAYSAL